MIAKDVTRKGNIFVKHTEYTVQVTAGSELSVVKRRYSDFQWLADVLSEVYPFRLVPALPHKKPVKKLTDEDFAEFRRLGLNEFVNNVLSRPVFYQKPEILVAFFQEEGKGFERAKKELRKAQPETELEFHVHSQDAGELLRAGIDAYLEAVHAEVKSTALAVSEIADFCMDAAVAHSAYTEAISGLGTAMTRRAGDESGIASWSSTDSSFAIQAEDMVKLGEGMVGVADKVLSSTSSKLVSRVLIRVWMHARRAEAFSALFDTAAKESKSLASQEKKLRSTEAKVQKLRRGGKTDGVDRAEEARVAENRAVAQARRSFAFVNYCLDKEAEYFRSKQVNEISSFIDKFVLINREHSAAMLNAWNAML